MREKIDAIIAKMSPAQRKAFLAMPTDTDFIPADFALQRRTVMALKSLRLIRPVYNEEYGPLVASIVTPLGKGVRNILEVEL